MSEIEKDSGGFNTVSVETEHGVIILTDYSVYVKMDIPTKMLTIETNIRSMGFALLDADMKKVFDAVKELKAARPQEFDPDDDPVSFCEVL